jgi:hypothetical protein
LKENSEMTNEQLAALFRGSGKSVTEGADSTSARRSKHSRELARFVTALKEGSAQGDAVRAESPGRLMLPVNHPVRRLARQLLEKSERRGRRRRVKESKRRPTRRGVARLQESRCVLDSRGMCSCQICQADARYFMARRAS